MFPANPSAAGKTMPSAPTALRWHSRCAPRPARHGRPTSTSTKFAADGGALPRNLTADNKACGCAAGILPGRLAAGVCGQRQARIRSRPLSSGAAQLAIGRQAPAYTELGSIDRQLCLVARRQDPVCHRRSSGSAPVMGGRRGQRPGFSHHRLPVKSKVSAWAHRRCFTPPAILPTRPIFTRWDSTAANPCS